MYLSDVVLTVELFHDVPILRGLGMGGNLTCYVNICENENMNKKLGFICSMWSSWWFLMKTKGCFDSDGAAAALRSRDGWGRCSLPVWPHRL